jgi:2-polyprenyl-6-hydroxyphenyl methylase/3-demethylubiquinone-9 3-methyltransferase
MLHKLNPVRLAYIRDWIDQHWSLDEHSRRPLEGKSALDVGCGAGLLAEPLARLGAQVTAVDPAAELIEAAREHCAGQGLSIDYRAAAVEDVAGEFDLVTAMEVIEHTADPEQFLRSLATRLATDGLMFLSTPNATGWSKLITVTLGEGLGFVPKGTHDFDKFIAPDRMRARLEGAGLQCLDLEGIAWTPTRGLHLSEDLSLNYLVVATRASRA